MTKTSWQKENKHIEERYTLTIERIRKISGEQCVVGNLKFYFDKTAAFILHVHTVYEQIKDGSWDQLTLVKMQEENKRLYEDISGNAYEKSYANPKYAVETLGETFGALLSFLYTEIRGEIPAAFEERLQYMTICNELFIEIYNRFEAEGEPEYHEIKNIIYWYASDYCDVFTADRIIEQIDASNSFARDIILHGELNEERYLYRFGEYITENELRTMQHLRELPEEIIDKMADVYTEGFRMGFVNTGKDLGKKSVVTIRYVLGFERVIKKAIENFAKMGLTPSILRVAVNVVIKPAQQKNGYYGAIVNKQYEYDHRFDQGLFLDKRYLERKLDVMKHTYETYKELAGGLAGPALIDMFGDMPFSPEQKKEAIKLSDKQKQLLVQYEGKSSQLMNQYIKGDERSFTVVAYPLPEIGEQYEAIFDEVIRINTLDATVYEKVQQTLIDALDQGDCVHILGKAPNKTDLTVNLYNLKQPEKETIFENCVADVNIPVGEVFTSPVLQGTNGVLHVSLVYLRELQYKDLSITFKDGKVTEYTCGNFEEAEEGKRYVKENILNNQEGLPLGEFAIGTNTTAYVVAKKYNIADKLPVLIAEKTGPHFAVGDTCYSWSEDIKVYNQNGKEIVARDNEVSLLRKESVEKAYFHCHTDITIPYEELGEISVITKDARRIELLVDGHFVLPGTEILNEPFQELN